MRVPCKQAAGSPLTEDTVKKEIVDACRLVDKEFLRIATIRKARDVCCCFLSSGPLASGSSDAGAKIDGGRTGAHGGKHQAALIRNLDKASSRKTTHELSLV